MKPSHDSENLDGQDLGDEEDDLGYYDDGVKRTLTDEQIEIFRHSELQALARQHEREGHSVTSDPHQKPAGHSVNLTASEHATTELEDERQLNKAKRKKGGKRQKTEPKPDLRKRTWDVVEKGLDSLDYD